MASLLSMSFIGVTSKSEVLKKEEVSKSVSEKNVPVEKQAVFEKIVKHAVVPAVKLELQKVAILHREILLGDFEKSHSFFEQKIILPKLLQTLFISAIQTNAP